MQAPKAKPPKRPTNQRQSLMPTASEIGARQRLSKLSDQDLRAKRRLANRRTLTPTSTQTKHYVAAAARVSIRNEAEEQGRQAILRQAANAKPKRHTVATNARVNQGDANTEKTMRKKCLILSSLS